MFFLIESNSQVKDMVETQKIYLHIQLMTVLAVNTIFLCNALYKQKPKTCRHLCITEFLAKDTNNDGLESANILDLWKNRSDFVLQVLKKCSAYSILIIFVQLWALYELGCPEEIQRYFMQITFGHQSNVMGKLSDLLGVNSQSFFKIFITEFDCAGVFLA